MINETEGTEEEEEDDDGNEEEEKDVKAINNKN